MGKHLLGLPLGDREERQVRLRVGGHEQAGETVRVVGRVIGEDVGGQLVLGLGAALDEDPLERPREPAPHGAQRIEPVAEEDGIDLDQRLGHLAAELGPSGAVGVVERQGRRGGQEAGIARPGLLQLGPERRGQPGSMRRQGRAEHRQLGRRDAEQPLPQVIGLRGIDRQQGEAGVQAIAARLVRIAEHPPEPRVGPPPVAGELLDDRRDVGRAGRPERLHQARGPQVAVALDPSPGDQGNQHDQSQHP